jgi:hypothetical protein
MLFHHLKSHMNLPSRACKLTFFTLFPCLAILGAGPVQAGTKVAPDAVKVDPKAVTFEPESRPWSFSAGAVVRSIDSDFHLSPPSVLPHHGRGVPGLFDFPDTRVNYDNGYIRRAFGFPIEEEIVGIVFGGSSHHSGRHEEFPGGFPGRPISEFNFYTHSFSFESHSADVSDTDVGVGPYLELSRRVINSRCLIVDAFVGWSYVETEHSTGNQTLATLTDTIHTYTYDGILFSDYLPPGFNPFPGSKGFVVTDPALLRSFSGFDAGYRNPRRTDRIFAQYFAVTRGDLDVHLNEVPIGLKMGHKFGCLTVLAELGGTLNVIDYDLDASTTWQRSTGSVISRTRWNDSASPVKVGLFGGLAAQCDLTKDGRIFVEAHGTYRWVDAVHAAAGPVSTEIDVSSWEGGLSLGVRL